MHDGSIGRLKELFDKSRLDSAFRSSNRFPTALPTQFPATASAWSCPADDRAALIAFLRTLQCSGALRVRVVMLGSVRTSVRRLFV